MKTLLAYIILLMACQSILAGTKAQTNYTMTDLGGGSASGINNRGDVTGFYYVSSIHYYAFLYKNGRMLDLGTLLAGGNSEAFGINDKDEVVGVSLYFAAPGPSVLVDDAFLCKNSKLVNLTPNNPASVAIGINNSGEVTGYFDVSNGDHAFIYREGQIQDLGTLGGYVSEGCSINNREQVVGYSVLTGGTVTHAFLYSNGHMQDLGALGPNSATNGNFSFASYINDHGQVVGYSNLPDKSGTLHAFLYTGGALLDLGVLLGDNNSKAIAINNSGEIVGNYYSNVKGFASVFLYVAGQMYDLTQLWLDTNRDWWN